MGGGAQGCLSYARASGVRRRSLIRLNGPYTARRGAFFGAALVQVLRTGSRSFRIYLPAGDRESGGEPGSRTVFNRRSERRVLGGITRCPDEASAAAIGTRQRRAQ